MPKTREFDSRKTVDAGARVESRSRAVVHERINPISGTPSIAMAAASEAIATPVEKALRFVRSQGFAGPNSSTTDFVPDAAVRKTSSGAVAVNLHQYFRGIPLFQMTRMVRFDTSGQPTDAAGDSVNIRANFSTVPTLGAIAAVKAAAQHLASTGHGEEVHTPYGPAGPVPTVSVDGYAPEVTSAFPMLASQPTVLTKGPFENPVPAHLVVFVEQSGPRLAWYIVVTLADYADQYVVMVAADKAEPELLYSKSTMNRVSARALVFEFNPGLSLRKEIAFPRPLSDYPVILSVPPLGFPVDWIADGKTDGNSTIGTLGTTTQTLGGVLLPDGSFQFAPADPSGNDQKLLNIFYFCNYMHDFLYMLGFDEEAGNFQRVNFTGRGLPNDPVRARAHAGPVNGTANMSTGPDGQPPVMNMGLVSGPPARHTAFDFDVVGHEYVHGLPTAWWAVP